MDKAKKIGSKTKTVPIHRNKFNLAEHYLADKYDFRFNSVSLDIEICSKGSSKFEGINENSIFRELHNVDFGLSMTNLIALLKSDFVEHYDPFIDYFENLPPWDDEDHIFKLASFIDSKDQSGWTKHLKKHLIRTVKCALVPTYYNKQALILVDPKQNSGKSTYNRFLCPPALKDYIAEDITTDKDSRILIAKNLLINLDELALLAKKEINSLKSFMSKDQINERLPYDRKNTILPRKASFIGSTNNLEFLSDETGSVRWLCFEINSINWNYSKVINIDKVWAQAYALMKSGFECDLTKEDILDNEERNKHFQVLTIEREKIVKLFDFDYTKQPSSFLTTTEVLEKMMDHSTGFSFNFISVGKALRSLNCPEGRDTLSRKGYFLKLKDFSK